MLCGWCQWSLDSTADKISLKKVEDGSINPIHPHRLRAREMPCGAPEHVSQKRLGLVIALGPISDLLASTEERNPVRGGMERKWLGAAVTERNMGKRLCNSKLKLNLTHQIYNFYLLQQLSSAWSKDIMSVTFTNNYLHLCLTSLSAKSIVLSSDLVIL